jgi:hypothetical protein
MPAFIVTRDFHQNGRILRAGDKIDMTERQARYLLLNGFLKKHEDKPARTAKGERNDKTETAAAE